MLLGHNPELEERGWEPAVELGDEPPVVEADAEALARIVENLAVSAQRPSSARRQRAMQRSR